MFDITKKSFTWNGKEVEIETGKIARQANAAVMVKMGGTQVLCTVVGKKEPAENIDFLPLIVNYQERFYADGKIPGGFIKRESKPSEREVLISRLIDRPIRPLFPKGFFNEVQVICTVVSYDSDFPTDIVAMIAVSTALAISDIPFSKTFGASRVGYKEGKFFCNPSTQELDESDLDLVVAGTSDSILMVESEAKELEESVMLEALNVAQENISQIIKIIDEFANLCRKSKWDYKEKDFSELYKAIENTYSADIIKAYEEPVKLLRSQRLSEIRDRICSDLIEKDENLNKTDICIQFSKLQKNIIRGKTLDSGKRIDGRENSEIRSIECETGILSKTHGSALFTRGETQVLAVNTLGTSQDEQMTDDLTGVSSERFMLHYNFPAFSVGEISPLRAPGRREIGHGKLAYKAIKNILPEKEKFPYSIRSVAEVTESNGSSSMATVCSTVLALMDTGVPIKSPVAGIAMGLIKEKEKYMVLSDIMGDEDFLGDMDFKVAGTVNGITALQMDIKITGISMDIMKDALAQAKEGRQYILDKMLSTIDSPRGELSENAPRIKSIKVKKDQIKDIIGSGGKVIREICEKSEAKVDIDDDGKVSIFANSQKSLDIAYNIINEIISEPETGNIYNGIITKVLDFGIFVKFFGNTEGLVHISEIVTKRIANIEELLSEGEQVSVKMIAKDRNGKIKLTMKGINQPDNITQKSLWVELNDTEKPSEKEEKSNNKNLKKIHDALFQNKQEVNKITEIFED